MSFTTQDKEARKFETDPADSSKVVVKTKVENTDSDAVPVKIINTDANIDVEVSVPSTITIDDSTPVDVNVTTNPVNVNSTIQGTPNVNVTNSVDIDDATPVRVDVTNATLATNATIQNTNLITRPQLNVGSNIYNYISGDNNGRQYIYQQTHWDTTAIAILQQSTTVSSWINAYADDVLQKKYIETYNDEFEETVYYTHGSLTTGKCLKLIHQYSTQNSQKVLQSIHPSVADWTFEDEIAGTVSVVATNISPASPNSTISMHTPVADLTITDNTFGAVTITLSGASASLYHIHNTNTGAHGSSMTFDASHSYQIHTAGTDFSGSSYSHALTITVTGDVFGVTDSTNITLNGTYAAVTWANEQFVTDTATNTDNSKKGNWATDSFTNNKGWFPSLENNSSGDPSGIYSEVSDTSISFWFNTANWNVSGSPMIWYQIYHDHAAPFGGTDTPRGYMAIYLNSNYLYYHRSNRNYNVGGSWAGGHKYWLVSSLSTNTWYNFTLSIPQNSDTKLSVQNTSLYIDGSLFTTGSSYYFSGYNPDVVKVVRAGLGGTFLNFSSHIDSWTSGTTSLTSKWDEVTTWSKALTSSEASELYNSGAPMDPSTHSASSYLERYIRCGDDSNDSTSLHDASGATDGFALTHWNNVDKTTGLTGSDSIYVPAAGSFVNTYYLAQNSANSMQFSTSDIQLTSNTKWCFSFWMKSSQFTDYGSQQRIWGAPYSAGSNGFQMRKRNSYTNIWELFFNGASSTYLVAEYTIPNNANLDNTWVHVLVNYDYDNSANSGAINDTIYLNSLDLYINGTACSKADSAGYSSGTHATTTVNHGINHGHWGSSTLFVEAYDELAYWSGTSLSTSEIALVYNSGNKVIDLENTTNLTAPNEWWRHEDSSNLTYETISAANSGTLTGATQTAY